MNQIKKNLTISIQNTERKFNEIFDHSNKAASLVIKDVRKKPANIYNINKIINQYKNLRYQNNNIPLVELSWIDLRNNIIADTRHGVISLTDSIKPLSSECVDRSTKGLHKLHIGKRIIDPINNQHILPVEVSIEESNLHHGCLVLSLDISKVARSIKEINLNNISIIVLSHEDSFLLSTNSKYSQVDFGNSKIADLVKTQDRFNTSFSINLIGSDKFMGAIKNSLEYPFSFIAIYDEKLIKDTIYQSWSTRIKILLLITLSFTIYILSSRFIILRDHER